MPTKTIDAVVKNLTITGNYSTYDEFYSKNKILVFKDMIDLFKELKNEGKNLAILNLSANINGQLWKTDLKFHRNQYFVLIRDMLPYFEKLEEYEICDEIKKLHEDLIPQN